MYSIISKLQYNQNNIGVLVSSGGIYSCALTLDKAKEMNIEDINDLDYIDIDIKEVIPTRLGYALVEKAIDYNDDYTEDPYLDDYYYGYKFRPNDIIPFNSDKALQRMENETLYD